jgi:hypothetical protein
MVALRGAPTNDTFFGLLAFGAVFGATTLYVRTALLGNYYRNMKFNQLWGGRAEPPKITSLAGLGRDLAPMVASWSLAAALSVAPASIAKAYVDGPGRFAGFVSYKGNPYRAQYAAVKEAKDAAAAAAAAASTAAHH